ncbi:MAG: diphosphomevalonate decarboxylase [Candidatus Lokiarchaeota archaeon]|nr:diphosphomevalonate decarboxylase [Candidatus Lokiarchaeota archaeon]MBD3199586.1 diphosphomevalonate decarboxylase [Candidatus Lokiarchaeota archaeon]
MKSSALAHPNIALIKYWGRSTNQPSYLNIPTNDSISMTKETIPNANSEIELITQTTIEFSESYNEDTGFLQTEGGDIQFNEVQMERIKKVVDALRASAKVDLKFKMISKNMFPTAAGLASSASAFAALATCASDALNLGLNKRELSMYARLGSGSASRSIHGGFVRWNKGDSHETSFAEQICECNEFNIAAIIALINRGKKEVSSDVGINYAHTSIFNPVKIKKSEEQAIEVLKAIREDDFRTVGSISEKNCLYMHSVMMTSDPPLFYWNPNTLKVIRQVVNTRRQFFQNHDLIKKGIQEKGKKGLECYFTVDAGPNIHCLCRNEDIEKTANMLCEIGISETDMVRVRPSVEGSRVVKEHLF